MGSHGPVLRVGVEKFRGGDSGHRLYNAWGQFQYKLNAPVKVYIHEELGAFIKRGE